MTVKRDEVEKAVNDAGAVIHYPRLLERYFSFDSTLTHSDFRLLYYGFVFQDYYHSYVDQKKAMMNKLYQEKKFDSVIKVADEVLERIPISIMTNYLKIVALSAIDDSEPLIDAHIERYRNLLDAIISSGDGKTCETAFKTIFIPDEYEISYAYLKGKKVFPSP